MQYALTVDVWLCQWCRYILLFICWNKTCTLFFFSLAATFIQVRHSFTKKQHNHYVFTPKMLSKLIESLKYYSGSYLQQVCVQAHFMNFFIRHTLNTNCFQPQIYLLHSYAPFTQMKQKKILMVSIVFRCVLVHVGRFAHPFIHPIVWLCVLVGNLSSTLAGMGLYAKKALFNEAECIFGNRLTSEQHKDTFNGILHTVYGNLFDADRSNYYFVPNGTEPTHLRYVSRTDWTDIVKRSITICSKFYNINEAFYVTATHSFSVFIFCERTFFVAHFSRL